MVDWYGICTNTHFHMQICGLHEFTIIPDSIKLSSDSTKPKLRSAVKTVKKASVILISLLPSTRHCVLLLYVFITVFLLGSPSILFPQREFTDPELGWRLFMFVCHPGISNISSFCPPAAPCGFALSCEGWEYDFWLMAHGPTTDWRLKLHPCTPHHLWPGVRQAAICFHIKAFSRLKECTRLQGPNF